jgi:hypothetical protein
VPRASGLDPCSVRLAAPRPAALPLIPSRGEGKPRPDRSFDWGSHPLPSDHQALCVDKSHPVSRHEFRNLGSDITNYNTFISSNTYECGIAGIAGRNGDIQENHTANIIRAYLFASGGTWRINADFHHSHNSHESWDVDVLCVQR